MKRKGISHFALYLVTVGISALSVIQSQGNLLPEIVGIPVYILAAMLLTAAFICLYKDLKSGIIERFFITVKKNAFGAHFLEDYRFRTVLTTMPSFVINVAYTIYNGVIGVMNQSAWFITMAVYYSLLGIMRYCAVHTERKISHMEDQKLIRKKELAVIKTDGILLLLLNLALSGVVLLTIAKGRAKAYSEIIAISIAAYTFYKITMAVIRNARQRQNPSLLLRTLRSISYAEIAASVLTLQRSMLVSFGTMGSRQIYLMNAITGAVVCLFVWILGLSMIEKSKRKENESWQNQNL